MDLCHSRRCTNGLGFLSRSLIVMQFKAEKIGSMLSQKLKYVFDENFDYNKKAQIISHEIIDNTQFQTFILNKKKIILHLNDFL